MLDVQAAPSTASEKEYDFADFKKEQAEALKNNASVELEQAPKAAPPSEVEVTADGTKAPAKPQQKQALTDEEKSARKHANDGKRIPEFYRQISEKDAEIARLNRELAARGTSATPAKQERAQEDPNDPEPDPNDPEPDPNDPKYQGEKGALLWIRDETRRAARQELRTEREQRQREESERSVSEARGTFNEKWDTYKSENATREADLDEALTIVVHALDTEFPEISKAIVGYENSAGLIDHLGTNLDVLSRITSAKGQPMAMKLYRAIVQEFEQGNAPVAATTTRKSLPNPPVNLNGKGRTPTSDEIQDKAAEDDDFTTWRQAEHAKKKGKDKWGRDI